ncbi:unnamed protein product [Orchesella dallaii]|uniref:Uncharacterized protein n=1 Tax=Orchesella dallaii TaxID=48710 RepID=A0ABP1SB59_9HEXA
MYAEQTDSEAFYTVKLKSGPAYNRNSSIGYPIETTNGAGVTSPTRLTATTTFLNSAAPGGIRVPPPVIPTNINAPPPPPPEEEGVDPYDGVYYTGESIPGRPENIEFRDENDDTVPNIGGGGGARGGIGAMGLPRRQSSTTSSDNRSYVSSAMEV